MRNSELPLVTALHLVTTLNLTITFWSPVCLVVSIVSIPNLPLTQYS